jgi:hypothetical protein
LAAHSRATQQQLWIELLAELGDDIGQRVIEVPVLPRAEAVARHVDRRAEPPHLVVQAGDLLALRRRQQRRSQRAPVLVELFSPVHTDGTAVDADV